jgi:alpha-mannosidase
MVRSAALLLLSLRSVAGWTEQDINKVGGYKHVQTVPYWTDLPADQRSKVPAYVPPKDWVYNTKGGPVEGKINVHLVPHTHDDTGWQVTVDQYFFRNVYYIIDTVVSRLTEDPNRKFIYVEVGFFARWWDQQPEKKRDMTRRLVKNGQLEFINGGWCMHDEASPDYVAMVDQTTRGHQFLLKNFGKDAIPRGTWQVDPFGHSNTEAWLLGAESGYESVFWGRTDYQDLNTRKNFTGTKKGFEWIWEGSQSLGASAQIFAGELYGGGNGGYGTWIGYDGDNPQVQDDPKDHDYNVDQVIDQFVQNALSQAAHTQSSHQLWACGSDFNYQNADHWYHNLDKIIHYANLNGSVNVFYSTPSIYVDEKKKAGLTWEKRYDDIWPLADDAHHYWSGYFTSRPALKRQVRIATHTLDAARQMEASSGTTAADVDTPTTRPSPPVGNSWTDSLEGMIGVTTHHDAMSGTERQDVADDYAQRMTDSMRETEVGIGKSLQKLMGTDSEIYHCNCNSDGAKDCLNVTMCAFTSSHDHFKVIAWNPLATEAQEAQTLRIPVTGGSWAVTDDSTGKAVPAQIVPIDNRTLGIPLLYINYYGLKKAGIEQKVKEYQNTATHVLVFSAKPPAMGYSTFSAKAASSAAEVAAPLAVGLSLESVPETAAPFSVDNGVYKLTFDPATGMMTSITNLKTKITTSLEISWGWYNSSVGGCTPGPMGSGLGCDGQASGAYIFRPNSSTVFFPGPQQVPKLQVVKGPVVTEVHQTFSDWATHVVRLEQGRAFVEVEWTAGPIPIDTPWLSAAEVEGKRFDNWGKEVIVKYKSGLESAGTFWTDANGREMVKRQYNARGPSYPKLVVNEPVAGNYYPVNTLIAIQDKAKKTEMAIVTDVTQGGASLENGEMELMVHRRVQHDDSRGVQEPLNETMCGCNDINAQPGQMGAHGHEGDGGCWCAGLTVRGRHWLIFDTIENVHDERRQLMERLSFPATTAFTDGAKKVTTPTWSALQTTLPKNVRLMTVTSNYADFNQGQVLVRFAHLYSIGEHPTLSQPATISMTDIFGKGRLKIKSARAMSVSGNQGIEEMDAKKFAWKTHDLEGGKVDAEIEENGKPFEKRFPFNPSDPKLRVTLRPMEVLTFFVTFEKEGSEIVI